MMSCLGKHGGVRILLIFFAISGAAEMARAAPAIQILKVDPSPVSVGGPLVIVYRIGNTGTAQGTFQLQMVIDSPSTYQYQTLAAGGSQVLSWGTTVTTPGNKTVTLHMWEQVGSRTVQSCPGCPRQTIPIYGNLVSVSEPLMVFAASNAPLRPQMLNIGPPGKDGSFSSSDSETGVMNKVAGDSSILYAVSTHAGVWRSTSLGNWVQLTQAPPRAASIAVDPSDNRHLIVGERGDDNFVPNITSLVASRSGAWESTDAGDTWMKIYDPGLDPNYPSTGLGSVRDVVFAPYGKLIMIATARGIGVREATGAAIGTQVTVFPTAGDVRELAVSANTVWGWTTDHQLLMLNMPVANWKNPLAPLSWTSFAMPPTVTVSMADPGDSRTVADVLTNCGVVGCENIDPLHPKHPPGGLAGFDDHAVLVFTPFVSLSHPLATEDPACKNPPSAQVCDIFQNRIGVLVFKAAGSAWSGQLTKDRDGRGLGGKAFAVAATLNCPALPDELSERQRFYVSSGQGLQEALAQDSDGRYHWDNPVGGAEFQAIPKQHWGGPYGGHATNIHVDFWDFHVDPNVCPSGHFTSWLANDGGIYQADVSGASGIGTRPNPKFVGTLTGLSWQMHNAGLWTHNVNALVAVKRASDTATHLYYATGDNDGFWGVSAGSLPGLKPGQWRSGGTAGDAISGVADGSSMSAAGMRDYWAGGNCGGHHDCAYLTDLQSGSVHGFNVGGWMSGLVSSTVFTFIQSTQAEVASGSVKTPDAVILVNLPIQEPGPNGTRSIPGIYGQKVTTARTVILRNKSFDKSPDGTSSHFSKWSIARDNLPAGTERFWVSGGHGNPVYYFFTPSSTTCPGGLVGDISNGKWPCLMTNLALSFGSGAISGPAFVSPYQPQTVFVLQLGTSPGIEYTTNGGTTFCPAPNLTQLVTGSGQFPQTQDGLGKFDPSNRFLDAGEAYHGSVLPMISDIAFDRSDLSTMLVISPLSGVYFGRLGDQAKCTEPIWQALQGPTDNWGYPSTGVLLDGTAFIGTEGRGIFEISGPASGLLASYFEIDRARLLRTTTVTLKSSSGSPIPWALYSLIIRGQGGSLLQAEIGQRTDGDGMIDIPGASVNPTVRACELNFFGDGQNAPTSMRFDCSTQ